MSRLSFHAMLRETTSPSSSNVSLGQSSSTSSKKVNPAPSSHHAIRGLHVRLSSSPSRPRRQFIHQKNGGAIDGISIVFDFFDTLFQHSNSSAFNICA
uniref:Kinesin motor domain-containing protein n=1 Tax=Panagrellus redivivus TaxID=6233 RepID=A0A7E4UUD8_PANRE